MFLVLLVVSLVLAVVLLSHIHWYNSKRTERMKKFLLCISVSAEADLRHVTSATDFWFCLLLARKTFKYFGGKLLLKKKRCGTIQFMNQIYKTVCIYSCGEAGLSD